MKEMTSRERILRTYKHLETDHSIPNFVSFSTMCKIVEKLKELGKY